MNYYNILDFKKEPFSNSPEPEFLFQLPQYSDCLQKLELAVRLRRGINVVIGDVGTGKTTLCRKLIRDFSSSLADSAKIETHLMLDPAFDSSAEFLQTVASMLGIATDDCKSEWHLKEKIKDCLFDRGVDEKRIVVLIIDEGQKIPENCLEILREFLNYETNNFKLLQIIIFAQKEFRTILKKRDNLFDRVNLLYNLKSLNFRQTRAMINYRLNIARESDKLPSLFTGGGFAAVYLATGGYPRKIVLLCHQVVLKMIIRGKKKAGWLLVRGCMRDMAAPLSGRLRWAAAGSFVIIVAAISIGAVSFQYLNTDTRKPLAALPPNSAVPEIKKTLAADASAASSAVSEAGVQAIKMPDYLGKVPMTKKRTIWWTLYNIYGETSSDIMNAVFEANPHIRNGNRINEGTLVILPSIPSPVKTINAGDIVVALESGKNLEAIYNTFRNHPGERQLPPLAFLSFWNQEEGIQFAIVVDKCFNDMNMAREAVGKLPPPIAARTKILSQWNADTVFFNRRMLPH